MNVMIKRVLVNGMVIALAALMTGCEFAPPPLPQATPTIDTVEPTQTVTAPAATDTLSPVTPSQTLAPRLATATLTPTSSEPTATPIPSVTPGPYAYTIQPDDTFYYIVQRPPFNYENTAQINAMIPEFLALNPGVSGIDRLPSPGSVIYIPLQPPTPTPPGYELTRTLLPPVVDNFAIADDAPTLQVPIRENDTILRFAQEYETTLAVIATLNPEIGFFGCDFDNPSGGPDCTVIVTVGENVNVPAPTPTPTLSPTPSGNETPTPTPTYPAPMTVFPPQNGVAPARTFQLQWISVGALQPNEAYFIEIEDMTAGTVRQDVARSTSYDLPDALVPADGQPHNMQWRVSVAVQDAGGTYTIVGALGSWRAFTWQSR